jgi:hypothetical protein
MPTIPVENLIFDFRAVVDAQKYDTWVHYTQVWNKLPASQKAVDVVAVHTTAASTVAWLIEAKDFRIVDPTSPPRYSNVAGLPQTMATKVIHTLAGLADAASNATVQSEKNLATKVMTAGTRRIVLHLEPHEGPHSALFPTGFAANVLQKLRQLVKATDSNPSVLNTANTPFSGVPWTVR